MVSLLTLSRHNTSTDHARCAPVEEIDRLPSLYHALLPHEPVNFLARRLSVIVTFDTDGEV
jgi:hypothetical protein